MFNEVCNSMPLLIGLGPAPAAASDNNNTASRLLLRYFDKQTLIATHFHRSILVLLSCIYIPDFLLNLNIETPFISIFFYLSTVS